MRLGIVMMGTGAYAAANVGVLDALLERGLAPYAVCGMHFGAWTAAQYLCGADVRSMETTLKGMTRAGKRLLSPGYSAGSIVYGKENAICDGALINRLLRVQTGERLLSLCDRRGIFPCRVVSSGRRIIFSTQAYPQGHDISLTLQATTSFACRAVMAHPPFLSAMPWLGSLLIPEEDPVFAADQLLRMGVDRVLIIEPRAAMAHNPDALELAYAQRRWALERPLPSEMGVLHLAMPMEAGALRFDRMTEISMASAHCARQQLDQVLEELGMAACRVLPFRSRHTIIHPG